MLGQGEDVVGPGSDGAFIGGLGVGVVDLLILTLLVGRVVGLRGRSEPGAQRAAFRTSRATRARLAALDYLIPRKAAKAWDAP